MSFALSLRMTSGTAYYWGSVTDPDGGCDSVEVAVLADTFSAARDVATRAGFRVTGRKPRERLPEDLLPPRIEAHPGRLHVKRHTAPDPTWQPA